VPAIFGLVGVAVGAGLTGIVEWMRESRRDAARARAAARLLRADILLVGRVVRSGIATRELPGFLDINIPTWREHRDLLAAALDDAAWAVVSAACSRLQLLADVQEQGSRWSRGRLEDDAIPRLDKVLTDFGSGVRLRSDRSPGTRGHTTKPSNLIHQRLMTPQLNIRSSHADASGLSTTNTRG